MIPSLNPIETMQNCGIDTLDELEDNQFSVDVPRDLKSVTLISLNACCTQFFATFLHARLFWTLGSLHQKPLILCIVTRLCWFPASEATDPEHCDDYLSVPCCLIPQN